VARSKGKKDASRFIATKEIEKKQERRVVALDQRERKGNHGASCTKDEEERKILAFLQKVSSFSSGDHGSHLAETKGGDVSHPSSGGKKRGNSPSSSPPSKKKRSRTGCALPKKVHIPSLWSPTGERENDFPRLGVGKKKMLRGKEATLFPLLWDVNNRGRTSYCLAWEKRGEVIIVAVAQIP